MKQDFNHVMSILEVEPQDNAHNLFMALTQNGKRSIITMLTLDRSTLKGLKATDADNNALALDDWEVSKIIKISRYAACLQEEKGEDFRLKDIDASLFEDFKLSPTSFQMTRTREDMSRSSSTRGQPNPSRPSISPTHVASTSSSSIEASPPITDDSSPDSQLDSEPSSSINQLFHQMMGPFPITNGDGSSHETCATHSTSSKSTLRTDKKCSDVDCKVKDSGPTKEIDSFLPTASRNLSCENDCDMPFDEVAIDYSFQQAMASSNDVGRSPAATPNSTRCHPRAYDPSDVHSSNPPFTSTAELSFEDLETFENNILAETSNLRDDFSHSSHSSNASSVLESTEFSSCIEIQDMIRNASKVLDQKLDEIHEILNFDSQDPSSLKSPPLSNGDLEGHVLTMQNALYGLRTSGLRWHERLADCLRDAGFFPCKMEPDMWMRKVEENGPRHYEFIAVYADDLLIASKLLLLYLFMIKLLHLLFDRGKETLSFFI